MYDIRPAYNAKSVKDYLARDEPGIDIKFGGKLFEHLGIDPETFTLLDFNRLIDGKHPETNENLTPRIKAEKPKQKGLDKESGGRIPGWYVTLSPVKDVTLAALFSPQGEQVREALREAGDYVMNSFIEPSATVRDRSGVHKDRSTGNVAWVRLHHTLDRPVDGKIMPQEHLHYFIPNATFDEERGRCYATKMRGGWWESGKIKRQFHKRLRENLEQIGFVTKGWGMHWRIDGIDRDLVDRFSLRRKEAKAHIEAGTHPRYAGLKGREPKRKLNEQDVRELKGWWDSLLTERDKQCLSNLVARPKWGRYLQPARKRMEFLRNLVPQRSPNPLKEMDFDIVAR